MNEYCYKFVSCPDEDEYWRLNHLGKRKGDYLGQVCRQVGLYPPYAMQFVDGAIWALDSDQVQEIGWAGPYPRLNSYKYNMRIICIENGMLFVNRQQAAKWAGVNPERISRAIHEACQAGGYHFMFEKEYANDIG